LLMHTPTKMDLTPKNSLQLKLENLPKI